MMIRGWNYLIEYLLMGHYYNSNFQTMVTLSEGNLLRQISSLNEELVEENNKITQALMRVLYSRQARDTVISPSNLLRHMEEQSKQLRNYTRSSAKGNKSGRGKDTSLDSRTSFGKSQKRCHTCQRIRDSQSKGMKQSDKSRLLAMRSYTSPPGRPTNKCTKESNITKLKKLSMKLHPKVSNQFLFKTRSRALNLGI